MLKKVIALLFVTLLVACSSDKKNEEKETVVEKNPYAETSINLSYNLKQGDKFQYRLTTGTTQTQELRSDTVMSIKTERSENYIVDTEVLRVTSDKQNALKITVSGIDMTGSMNGKNFSYDSKDKNSRKNTKEFPEYNILLDSPFRIIFGPDGEISNVLDGEKIAKKMIDFGGLDHSPTTEEKKYLEQQINANLLLPMCQQLYRKLPNKIVSIDSSWLVSYESGIATFKVTNNTKYTLKDIRVIDGDTLLYIDADLSAVSEGKNTAKDERASYNFQDPKILGKGKIVYNYSKGVFISSSVSLTVELIIQISTKDETGKDVNLLRRDITVNNYKVELL